MLMVWTVWKVLQHLALKMLKVHFQDKDQKQSKTPFHQFLLLVTSKTFSSTDKVSTGVQKLRI